MAKRSSLAINQVFDALANSIIQVVSHTVLSGHALAVHLDRPTIRSTGTGNFSPAFQSCGRRETDRSYPVRSYAGGSESNNKLAKHPGPDSVALLKHMARSGRRFITGRGGGGFSHGRIPGSLCTCLRIGQGSPIHLSHRSKVLQESQGKAGQESMCLAVRAIPQ